jgi:Kef-type K+ transport system membrane component KefB
MMPRSTILVLANLLLPLLGVGLFLLVRLAESSLQAPHLADVVFPARPAGHKIDVLLHVVATLAVVIAVGYVLGRLARLIGQPPVIGEVLAGIALGPSLLGVLSPAAMNSLVPNLQSDPHQSVTSALYAISQLGIILYMFLVGLELDLGQLKDKAQSALLISQAGIMLPFVLGSVLALWLYPLFSHQAVPFTSFALFLGVAMAITAFPVLARILTDWNLHRTPLGLMALSCAAADDVTAWCLLALVVGVARAEVNGALWVCLSAVTLIALMFLIVRPVAARLVRRFDHDKPFPDGVFSLMCVAILTSAWLTETIGIHAIFGGFLLGAILPHESRLAREMTARLRDPVLLLLLPAYFAYTGLRTQVGLVSTVEDWFFCGVILLTAVAGKFGGAALAARVCGYNWRDSMALGTLMNTRGLMELIVLNIGLDLGVISPKLFTMMVIMALSTTLMTAPILNLLLRPGEKESQTKPILPAEARLKSLDSAPAR